jgi:hypothetical protein
VNARALSTGPIARATSNPRGRALARELSRYLGTTSAITSTCSEIATRADRLQHYEMTATNDRTLTDREIAHVDALEREIASLVANLPRTDHGAITVRCDGDPRGRVVRLVVPGVPQDGNTWGLGGEYEV